MKKHSMKRIACATLAVSMLLPSILPVYAEQTNNNVGLPSTTNLRDHWSFDAGMLEEGNQKKAVSDAGNKTKGVLNGIEVVDTGHEVFGNALEFGEGANKYMRLDNYIDSGYQKTTYSMWYKYNTSIKESKPEASAVLLQHEDGPNNKTGRTILSLTPDGKYDTNINNKSAPTTKSINKEEWQHITIVIDQGANNQDTNKKIKYYVNGELADEKNIGSQVTQHVLPLRIGAHKESGKLDPHPMRGYIDEIYVYKRALTDEEAKGLYADKGVKLLQLEIRELVEKGEKYIKESDSTEDNQLLVSLKATVKEAKDVLAMPQADVDLLKSTKANTSKVIEDYKSKLPIDLTIDTNKVTQTIDADSIFGINHRFAFNGYGTFDSNTMKVKDDFKKLYQDANFGSIRYPGGTISNLFNWKTTLGPKDKRKNQIHGFYNTTNNGKDQSGIAPNFGIGEIATFADEVNSEIVYVYSLGRGSAQDAADLVEYLNAKVGTNPNGGIDWAEVRARNGHKDPYNVRYFEIGNEMNQSMGNGKENDGKSAQTYWTSYVDGKGEQDAYIEGGTAVFTQKYAVKEEDWHKTASRSDGTKNQVRYLRYANVNPGKLVDGKIVVNPDFKAMEQGVQVYVGTDGHLTQWQVVNNLKDYNGTAQVCEVDYATGAIKFGDGEHGKIPPKTNNIYATYKVKREGFDAISKAIKDTTEKINQAENKQYEAKVYTSYESEDFFKKMKNKNKEHLYDGMTIHPYSGNVDASNDTPEFYDQAMKLAEDVGIKKVENLSKLMPEGKVPVISEYGIFRNTQAQLRSQTHAIYIAKVLMEYVRLGSPYIQKHCLVDWYTTGADTLGPTQQAVIQAVEGEGADKNTGEGKYTFFSTPSAHVFKMLNSGFGDNILETQFSETPKMDNGVKSLSALASQDNQGNLYIAIVNVDREKDRSLRLNIKNSDVAGRKMTVQRLSTDDFTSANTKENPNAVNVTYDKELQLSENPTINVDKHSFVIVKIGSVDNAELKNVIKEAEGLNRDYYIDFHVVDEALNHAKEILNKVNVSQAEMDSAVSSLRTAIDNLVMKDADYSKVDQAIAEANRLNKKDYKDFSKVEEAIAAVVRNKKINEQSLVDKMAENIQNAIKSLEKLEIIVQEDDSNNNSNNDKVDNQIVENTDKQPTPETSDLSNIGLWITILMMSGSMYMIFRRTSKKYKK